MSGVINPLLWALRAFTGYHITLLAGRIEGGQVDVISLHAGTTKKDGEDGGKDFVQWDPEAFEKNVLKHFVRYLAAASESYIEFEAELVTDQIN